eukprot:scaffold31970_cov31-Tisochrysis_lutea.AAC.4
MIPPRAWRVLLSNGHAESGNAALVAANTLGCRMQTEVKKMLFLKVSAKLLVRLAFRCSR